MKIVAYIDNKRVVFDTEDVNEFGHLPAIKTEDDKEFYLSESSEKAGEQAREYWEDMAMNDPQGSTAVQSLEEWLDLHLDAPEEHFASYDGQEREFKCKHPDWAKYTVAYQSN
ncbi:MAG: hypothetical protein B7C24_15790 [Bacteroidetes bacterium 4572_77]|nr:MAG: hypothetical protein B7C24_15790 [Bacteroidetes bacterium 4572_77]